MRIIPPATISLAVIVMISAATPAANGYNCSGSTWIDSFNLEDCTLSPSGSTSYFFLEPGYQLTLEGQVGGDKLGLVITVLNETSDYGCEC